MSQLETTTTACSPPPVECACPACRNIHDAGHAKACRAPMRRKHSLSAARPVPLETWQAVQSQVVQHVIGACITLHAALGACDFVALQHAQQPMRLPAHVGGVHRLLHSPRVYYPDKAQGRLPRPCSSAHHLSRGRCPGALSGTECALAHWELVHTLSGIWRLCMDCCCPVRLPHEVKDVSKKPSPRLSALLLDTLTKRKFCAGCWGGSWRLL